MRRDHAIWKLDYRICTPLYPTVLESLKIQKYKKINKTSITIKKNPKNEVQRIISTLELIKNDTELHRAEEDKYSFVYFLPACICHSELCIIPCETID